MLNIYKITLHCFDYVGWRNGRESNLTSPDPVNVTVMVPSLACKNLLFKMETGS